MKKILLFTTGGTIASKEGNNGLEPEMDANELLSYMGDLANRYDITCRELLSLDSSNIQAEEWRKIARNIFENLEQYDGIVVTHGTDTMAYTASMLSFMLQNLTVPVVLTGSQMPIDNMLTEARNNLYAAFAASEKLYPHLLEIDRAARDMLDYLMPRLAREAGATEALKAADPMKWVGLMNNCKAIAEEIVMHELIYV